MFETYILPVIILAVLGLIAGILLTFASRILAVKTDERLSQLQDALPQINCGSCGYSGCNAYAEAVLGGAAINCCKPGGDAAALKMSKIMGVAYADVVEEVAFVRCAGNCTVTTNKYNFEGAPTCVGANRFYNGSKTCTSGCLGFGDCEKVCPEHAICLVDGIAVINQNACVGCGICAKTCPNNLISIKPRIHKIDVACSSTSIGKVTKNVCKTGCIGCKICEKNCPSNAIKVENNFASIDYSLCTQCGICVEKCPVGAIVKMEG